MSDSNSKEQLLLNIANAIHVDSENISLGSSNVDFDEWDSMGILEIMTMLDSKYGVRVEAGDASACNSVKGIIRLLELNGLLS